MARLDIIVYGRQGGDPRSLRPRGRLWKFRSVAAAVALAAVLIGLFITALVIGSVIAGMVLIMVLISVAVAVLKFAVRQARSSRAMRIW